MEEKEQQRLAQRQARIDDLVAVSERAALPRGDEQGWAFAVHPATGSVCPRSA